MAATGMMGLVKDLREAADAIEREMKLVDQAVEVCRLLATVPDEVATHDQVIQKARRIIHQIEAGTLEADD